MYSDLLKSKSFGAEVDFTLVKNATLEKYRRGKLLKTEICDAQNELLRVAKNYGSNLQTVCPVCGEVDLVSVAFAFGKHITKSGICITNRSEIFDLVNKSQGIFLYQIEVCTGCRWNHLIKKSEIFKSEIFK
jgi:hypothetical protein